MAIYDNLGGLDEFFYNPFAVLFAFFLIVFASAYTILFKTVFKEDKNTAGIVSGIIAFISIFYFDTVEGWWFYDLRILYFIVILGVAFVFFKPFLKFLRRTF